MDYVHSEMFSIFKPYTIYTSVLSVPTLNVLPCRNGSHIIVWLTTSHTEEILICQEGLNMYSHRGVVLRDVNESFALFHWIFCY